MAVMDNIAEQIIKEVDDHLSENEKPALPASAKTALKSQVLEIKSKDHRIRALISKTTLIIITVMVIYTDVVVIIIIVVVIVIHQYIFYDIYKTDNTVSI